MSQAHASCENIRELVAISDAKPVVKRRHNSVGELCAKMGTKEMLFKIIVIGDRAAGKTSIIKRYVHDIFSDDYKSTVGVDFALKVINMSDGMLLRLQLWDIAGQERYGSMTRVYYKDASGVLLVSDVTRPSTFESVIGWKKDVDTKVQLSDGTPVPVILLANKCDMPKEGLVKDSAALSEFCQQHGIALWFETSAKFDVNIKEAVDALIALILENDAAGKANLASSTDTLQLEEDTPQTRLLKKCAC